MTNKRFINLTVILMMNFFLKSERSIWRSEFVECRYIRANISRAPERCTRGDQVYCCYNNIKSVESQESEDIERSYDMYSQIYCCTLEEFKREHKTLLSFITFLVWINVSIFVILMGSSVYLIRLSIKTIEEDKNNTIDMINRLTSLRKQTKAKSNASPNLKTNTNASPILKIEQNASQISKTKSKVFQTLKTKLNGSQTSKSKPNGSQV